MGAVNEVCGERKTAVDSTVHSAAAQPRPSKRSSASSTFRKFRFRNILPAAACVATLSVATTSVEAVAQESPLTAIISEISRHEADINRINLEIGNLREAVNQALVDLHDAQSLAEQARRGAHEARQRLNETQAEVEQAQSELDQISRSSYRASGANGSPVRADADARKDSLDRQTYLRKESEEKQQALVELQRARTEAANNESTLRQASRLADERAATAEAAETHARVTLEESLTSLETQLAQRDAAFAELTQAQTELVEQRPEAAASIGIDPETLAAAPEEAPASAAPGSAEDEPAAAATTANEADTADVPETSAESAPTASTTVAESGTESATESATETEAESSAEATSEETTEAAEPAAEEKVEEQAESSADSEAEGTEVSSPESPAAPSLEDFANPDTVQAALDAFAQAVGETQAEHTNFDNPYSESTNSGASEESTGIAAPSSSDSADAAVAATDEEEGTNVAGVLPEVDDAKKVTDSLRGTDTTSDASRSQQIEAVIARAESQIGTPYVWGGGDANGATMGLDGKGYNGKAGYDCSGLVLYAYSGAGISLPHYTGYQYQRGTQIPVDQAERGDLLFWGNGGSQHVAIYLGDGMMLEAPQTGMNVQKTAVRRSGLAPMAVRLI